jgi:uncharacterized phiE125 gp8 family phage protein
MRVPFNQYVLVTPASALPISLDEVKTQAKLDADDTSEDTYLQSLILAAVNRCESYIRRDLINKTYRLYLNRFPYSDTVGIEIKRSKLQSISFLKYYLDGVLTTLSSANYYFADSADYSSIYLIEDVSWPTPDTRRQAVQIEFVAGYGSSATSVPDDIRQALLQHVTFMYQSRGDSGDGGFSDSLPATTEQIYKYRKIYSIC